MTQKNVPFASGFVLSNRDFGPIAHFEKRALPNGLWWWSDSFVDEDQASAENGDFLIIRGHWASGSEDGIDDSSARRFLYLAQESIALFEDELDYMCGRYLIVLHLHGNTWIYNDAIGNRTVYYAADQSVATSHLNLLNQVSPHELLSRSLEKARVAKYQWAADLTPYKNVRHVLPNHKLNWDERETVRFYPREANPFYGWDSESKYAEIERVWRAVQAQYFDRYSRIAFSISGGVDSRVVLAMAKPYWDRIVGYTYGLAKRGEGLAQRGTFFGRTMENDESIVRQMLSSCDFKDHVYFNMESLEKVDDQLEHLLENNTVGSHGKRLVASYRRAFEGPWLNIRGNAIELSRTGNSKLSFGALVEKCQGDFPADVTSRLKALGYDSNLYGYGRGALTYWEFRHGKWLGEIHNELDAAFDTWVPAGIRRVRDLMAAFDEQEVRNSLVVRDLIERNAPELNRYPVNSQETLYSEWRELKREQLNNGSGRAPLSAEVVNPQGDHLCDVEIKKSFRMPTNTLQVGNRMRVFVHAVKMRGTLCFRVHQPYTNPAGRNYIQLAVVVNGKPMFAIDGAEYGGPINISIDNLRPGDNVHLEETFQRNLPGSESWSRATRMGVSAVKFFKQKSNGERTLRHDLPV
ncbi:hypothetical protein M7M4_17170 [Corynebacterium pseudogenitalium]